MAMGLWIENRNFRINKYQRISGFIFIGNINDNNALVDINLGCCQPYPGSGIHRLEHVIDGLL